MAASVFEIPMCYSPPPYSRTVNPVLRTVCIGVSHDLKTLLLLEWAAQHYLRQQDLIVLLHVRESISNVGSERKIMSTRLTSMQEFTPLSYEAIKYMEKQERIYSRDLLKNLSTRLVQEHGFTNLQCYSLFGEPKEALARKVNQLQPSALLLASGGQKTTLSKIFGQASIGKYCVKQCMVPVVRVKVVEDNAKLNCEKLTLSQSEATEDCSSCEEADNIKKLKEKFSSRLRKRIRRRGRTLGNWFKSSEASSGRVEPEVVSSC